MIVCKSSFLQPGNKTNDVNKAIKGLVQVPLLSSLYLLPLTKSTFFVTMTTVVMILIITVHHSSSLFRLVKFVITNGYKSFILPQGTETKDLNKSTTMCKLLISSILVIIKSSSFY